jgi:hypothetical protein
MISKELMLKVDREMVEHATVGCSGFGKIRSASLSRHEQLLVYDPDEGSLQGHARRLLGGAKHEAVVGVDLPDNVMSTLSTPNTEGGPCVCRLTAIVAANLLPS